jgi:uncharacterized protein YdeI (BOF family)
MEKENAPSLVSTKQEIKEFLMTYCGVAKCPEQRELFLSGAKLHNLSASEYYVFRKKTGEIVDLNLHNIIWNENAIVPGDQLIGIID